MLMDEIRAVTLINRMLDRGIDAADLPDWITEYTDLDSAHWAYAYIMEASNGHLYDRNDNGKETWADKLPD